jgi:protein subunit release factor B
VEWARALLDIYTSWAERLGFAVEWLDGQPDLHEADHPEALLRLKGACAFGLLRGEAGEHRLIDRSAGKRRVLCAAVEVLPDGDLPPIPPAELRFDVFRSGPTFPYS